MEIGDGVACEAIAGQVEHVGVMEIDPPAVPLEDVLLDDPMKGLPGRPLFGEIADGGDAGAVIVAADVSPQDRVARRPKHEHDAGVGASGEMGGVVRPVGAAVATGFVLEKLVLVGGAPSLTWSPRSKPRARRSFTVTPDTPSARTAVPVNVFGSPVSAPRRSAPRPSRVMPDALTTIAP
jgi:hypothetical protein